MRAPQARRQSQPFERTLDLADVIQGVLPRPKPGQAHPATRSFQALRIAVNHEFDELFMGLHGAEEALAPGGLLMVVTFHSLEDRMVKRFLQLRSGHGQNANRFAPEMQTSKPTFDLVTRKAVSAEEEEVSQNPRARSARLRVGRRTAPALKSLSATDLECLQSEENDVRSLLLVFMFGAGSHCLPSLSGKYSHQTGIGCRRFTDRDRCGPQPPVHSARGMLIKTGQADCRILQTLTLKIYNSPLCAQNIFRVWMRSVFQPRLKSI